MYKYILYFIFLSELIGVVLMEHGAYGGNIGEFGYKNCASIVFLLYIFIILFVFYFISKTKIFSFNFKKRTNKENFKILSLLILVANLFFLCILLFGFGAINVLTHQVLKGEFRANLGFLGALPYMIFKWMSPVLLAYLSFVYTKSSKVFANKFLLFLNFLVVFMIGASWGFKASGILILMPSLVLIYWKISFKKILLLGTLFICIVIFFAMFYDNKEISLKDLNKKSFLNPSGDNAILAIVRRLTILQGDVSWKIWDMYIHKQKLPSYSKTLLAVVGDKILYVFADISKTDYAKFVEYHYSLQLSYLMGHPLEQIKGGYNLTGTVFSEGIFAFGIIGLFIFSIIAGVLAGINYKIINYSIKSNNAVIASIASTYFCSVIFAWLNGGDIVILLHISTIFSLILSYLLLKSIIFIQKNIDKFF